MPETVSPPRSRRPGALPRVLLCVPPCLASWGCADVPEEEAPPTAQAPTEPGAGRWNASLQSPGGPLTFGLDLVAEEGSDDLRAVLVNGAERRPAGKLVRTDGGYAFAIPPYRSRIVATLEGDGRALVGYWERDMGAGPTPLLPFAAIDGAPDPSALPKLDEGAAEALSGTWRVEFEGDEHPSVGQFAADPTGVAHGTFLTTLGDYRFLAGRFDGRTLLLSCFDGAHAFLFEAELLDDGSLTGDFWSRDSYHTTWTAVKDPDAALPDDFALTEWRSGTTLADLRFPDTTGTLRSLDDAAFAGSARLLVVFGSWCPNCNDLTEYLVELQGRYDGLSILGIAFELSEDPAARQRAVADYLSHHDASYPVLIGGPANKQLASSALPILDRVRAYPTTVFMDRQGQVSAVHTGFSGPATGPRHAALRERFESEIESLLARD